MELGLVRVVEIATAQDVGKAMNPLAVEGQIEGGIAQGLGLALMEEIQVVDGLVRNASFTDYLIPTVLDMPPVELDVLELGDPDSPYGLRGIGEPPTISSTPGGRRGAARGDRARADARAGAPGRHGRPVSRAQLIAVARGDAEPDLVISGARVFSRLHARVAGRRRGDRRRADRRRRRVRRRRADRRPRAVPRARVHRRARPPRVGEAHARRSSRGRSCRAGRPRSSAIRTRSPTWPASRASSGCSARPRGCRWTCS